MVAETFLLRAGGCPPPSLDNRSHCLHLVSPPGSMGIHPPPFVLCPVAPLTSQAGPFLIKPGSSCSPFASLCATLVLEHPPQPSSFWAAPSSSSLQLFWCLSAVCLCLDPVRQAVYGGVLPVCCPAEAGRNSDGSSPAFAATVCHTVSCTDIGLVR